MKSVRSALVIDDEKQIRRLLRLAREGAAHKVYEAETGQAGLTEIVNRRPDVVLLDLGLPDMEGAKVLRRLREWSDVPVLILSVRDDPDEKVAALDAGADDYVTKPFGMEELLARIRVQLRRVSAAPKLEASSPVLEVGDFRIDLESRSVLVKGAVVHLTPKEYDLLVHFVQNAGKVLTHHRLLAAVWGGNYTEQGEYLRVFVGQLRKKIEPTPSSPRYILTEPWIGYRFNADS